MLGRACLQWRPRPQAFQARPCHICRPAPKRDWRSPAGRRQAPARALAIGPNFPLAQALGNGRLAIANPASVPAGKYGKAALEALGVWTSVEGRLAPAPDVRAALELVCRREAPLGIVYQTDAVADQDAEIVGTFPAASHPPIIYPLAVTAASTNPTAKSYIAFLQSPEVKAAFGLPGFALLR